jgi:hypothetical protein
MEETLIGSTPGLLSPEELRIKVAQVQEMLSRAIKEDVSLIVRELAEKKGLTIGHCTQALAAPDDDPYVQAARERIPDEGVVELDDAVVISPSSDGAYVLAWHWIHKDQIDADEVLKAA